MPEVTFKPDDGRCLPCLDGQARTEYRETASGLQLRVSSSGARSWAVAYYAPLAKTARRLKLGDAATMPLSKARAAARAALHAVKEEGRDPQADRVANRLQARQQRAQRAEERRRATADRHRRRLTFADVCIAYIEHRRKTPSGKYNRMARPNTLANWSAMVTNHVQPARLGSRPPEDVTREDVVGALGAAVERGGPSMGPRLRELIAAAWRWMESRPRSMGVELPAASPLAGIPKIGTAQKKRARALSPAELWRFWRAAADEGLEGEALRLSLLTATRVREARELPRSELDLEAAVWRLPAERNKSARDRAIPLSDQAVELLRRVQGQSGNDRVFGTPVYQHIAMKRIRAAMGGEPWQARDLRRTAATLCGRLGADPFTVALVLDHARPDERMPDVTSTYLRWSYPDQVRQALERLGAWVEETVTREAEPGDVVSITARR